MELPGVARDYAQYYANAPENKCMKAKMADPPSPFPKGRSFTKTFYVRIEIPGLNKPPTYGIAIIDEQSSVSMVSPSVIDCFNIDRNSCPFVVYGRTTVAGTSKRKG